MNKIVLLLILTIIAFSCKTNKKVMQSSTDYVVFSLRKTPCKGQCPVFFMEIYKSGKATFEGTKNIDKIGKYTNQIDKNTVDDLINKFKASDFGNFQNEYKSAITDLPSTYTSFSDGKTTKTVRNQHGAPEKLKELENLLEKIVSDEGWTKN